MIIGVTGHRPERLMSLCKDKRQVINWFRNNFKQGDTVISGMAAGVDLIAALVAVQKKLGVRCYYPFPREKKRDVDYFIQDNAAEIKYICDKYSRQSYIIRDRRIVDDCDVLFAVWDGQKIGGTWQTIAYAKKIGKPIVFFGGNSEEKV